MTRLLLIVREDRGHYLLVTSSGAVVEEADGFLRVLEARGLSPDTVRSYAFDLVTMYRWLDQEKIHIRDLTQRDLLDFVSDQRKSDASPKSINHRLVVIGLMYRYLTGRVIPAGAGASLPAPYYKGRGRDRDLGLHRIKNPRHRNLQVKTPRTLVEPLTAEQARLLIGSFKRYRDISIAYLMLLCGLRSREVLTLDVRDVSFDHGRLCVSGKGNKERVLPLPTLLITCLRSYLRLERPSVCRTSRLFVVLKGKRRGLPMTVSGMRSLFRYRRRNEKLKNANPHRLRHTFGTDMARSGVRLPILQKMMGHADSKTTLQYINLSMADVAAEFQRAAEEIHKRYKVK